MKQSNKKHILLRYSLVVAFMLLMACGIVFKLTKTTIIQGKEWNEKANQVLLTTRATQPERGKLLSDNGSVLAANLQFYVPRIDWLTEGIKEDTLRKYLPALADSLAVFDPSKTSQQWQEEIWGSYRKVVDGRKQGKRVNRNYRPFKEPLRRSEYDRLRTFPFLCLRRGSNGLHEEVEVRRCKPYGSMASRSIGVAKPDSSDNENRGRSGLEKALDSLLYGVPGVGQYIPLTNSLREVEITPSVPGYDITTTINIDLQDIVETELMAMCKETNAQWGTCVLMETATGEIKAISNLEKSKTNPGTYIEGTNNAVLGYEPGSVMKPISMMIALEDGIVSNIDEKITTGTTWIYEGRAITDPHGGAALSPREIIETSSNIGMSRIIVKKYGSDPGKFHDRLEGMGFFEPFNTGIAGETTPRIRRLENTKADRVALTRMAFGYATMIPPMSVLAMYNAIANDGKYVRPRLVKKLSREGEPDSIIPVSYIREQVCSPENAKKLRIMLHDVVWGSRGTARKWVQDERVHIAGKTGTAYTTVNGQYSTQKRLAFCGFFPYENPKYTCVVVMLGADRGAGASSGMVLKNVALRMYARGLLGKGPNYADVNDTPKTATIYATAYADRMQTIRKKLGIKSAKTFRQPQAAPKGGVPDVKGLGVREAIAKLENAGMVVSFRGTGYVVGQSLAPGSKFARGDAITLTLRD